MKMGSIVSIYNRSMNYTDKVIDEFTNMITSIFKNGFGMEAKRRTDYLKGKKYNAKVHCQLVCNSTIQDEDQMPFMEGYLLDSDSETDSDSSISSGRYSYNINNRESSHLNNDTNNDSTKDTEYELIVDDHLNTLLTKNYFKNETDKEAAVKNLLNLIPARSQITNKLYLKVMYKVI